MAGLPEIREVAVVHRRWHALSSIEAEDPDLHSGLSADVLGMLLHGYQSRTAGDAELDTRDAGMLEFACQDRRVQHAVSVMRAVHQAVIELALVGFYNPVSSV